ncbi:MAG: chemotaxis protein CheD [Hyphomicrobium sp.]
MSRNDRTTSATPRAAPPSVADADPPPGSRRIFFDQRSNSLVVWVCQGDYYVSSSPYEVLSTVLGSCIAVCMRDPVVGCGGMNHFLLPTSARINDGGSSVALRYGSYSIERLTNALIARGAVRERLEVKVFGGANIMSGGANFGHANADFVESYLKREGLKVLARSLRGTQPRRLRFHPVTGRAQFYEGREIQSAAVAAREARLALQLRGANAKSSIDIFDPSVRLED